MKTSGAAAVKPTEVVVEQVAGKKKSKFWYYAVEPTNGALVEPSNASVNHSDEPQMERLNGHANGDTIGISTEQSAHLNGLDTSISQRSLQVPTQNGD